MSMFAICVVRRSWTCNRREYDFDQTSQLADPDDTVLRDVCNVRRAKERQDVVLAHGEEIDVLQNDHLRILFNEERAVDDRLRVFGIALCEVLQRARDALRGLHQPLTFGIFPEQPQQFEQPVFQVPVRTWRRILTETQITASGEVRRRTCAGRAAPSFFRQTFYRPVRFSTAFTRWYLR